MVGTLITTEDVVLGFIKKATEYESVETKGVLGKKALQKSLYFFNQKQSIFSFRWGDYGPICGEIQQIAEDLMSSKRILVTDIQTKKKDAVIKKMDFSPECNPDFSVDSFPEEIRTELETIKIFVAGRSPRDLELLASVHYWAVREQLAIDSYSKEYVLEKLTKLKPDAGFTEKDVEYAIGVLEEQNYLIPKKEEE